MNNIIIQFLTDNSREMLDVFILIFGCLSAYYGYKHSKISYLISLLNYQKLSKQRKTQSELLLALYRKYSLLVGKTKYILYIKHDYSSGTCKWILQDIEGNDLQVSRDFNNSDFALNNAKSKLGFSNPIRITEYLYEIYLHSEH